MPEQRYKYITNTKESTISKTTNIMMIMMMIIIIIITEFNRHLLTCALNNRR